MFAFRKGLWETLDSRVYKWYQNHGPTWNASAQALPNILAASVKDYSLKSQQCFLQTAHGKGLETFIIQRSQRKEENLTLNFWMKQTVLRKQNTILGNTLILSWVSLVNLGIMKTYFLCCCTSLFSSQLPEKYGPVWHEDLKFKKPTLFHGECCRE